MRKALVALVVFSGIFSAARAVDRVERTAVLIVTEEASPQSPFHASVELRWEGDTPLSVSTWALKEGESTLGEIQVFDERGKEVQVIIPVSMPLMPTGKRVVRKGETAKFGLYLMGWPLFERGGNYYAIATFSDAWSGDVNVRFTTKKRWFKVAENAKKRPNKSPEPTVMSVTPRAGARVAPATTVAHL